MTLYCPNCESEYRSDFMASYKNGHLVKCSVCTQEWFQYNLSSDRSKFQPEYSELRKLAVEEYLFDPKEKNKIDLTVSIGSSEVDETNNDIKKTSDLKDIRERLKVSAVLLKEATEKLNTVESSDVKRQFTINTSTKLGFIFVSAIFIALHVLHFFSFELREIFPLFSNFLNSYYIFSGQVVEMILETIKTYVFLS